MPGDDCTALGQRFSILSGTGTGTKMEASIQLRAKDFAAHERWLANLADVITSNGLDDLWENQKLPTRACRRRQSSESVPASATGDAIVIEPLSQADEVKKVE